MVPTSSLGLRILQGRGPHFETQHSEDSGGVCSSRLGQKISMFQAAQPLERAFGWQNAAEANWDRAASQGVGMKPRCLKGSRPGHTQPSRPAGGS